ncbi:hypothetical protein HID58_029339 [Brassica napus]|uniref:S-protein homolog n=2 Tax=Brassica napus TaxID=3708 RepID=A0ABQ8CCV8_BRANA|nr:hypothetical protein HID58_029339 [Brassica napus]CDY22781.1 BnaA08g06110D [Brassica napus]
MDSLKHHIVFFITMIMFMNATMSCAQKTTVVIHNDLGSGLSLGYHCQSGDNDLGYGGLGQKRDKEFEKFGCTHCEWKIRKNGPCKLNKINNMFDVCLPWNS